MNSAQEQKTCLIDTGEWVGQLGGPHWTPYAQAIADAYDNQVPLYMTVPTTLTGVALQRRTIVTSPQKYDCLLFGAHATFETAFAADSGQRVFLQVTDLRNGLAWAAPTVVNAAPVTAYAGVLANPSPILKWPEAYFLPAGVQLQLDWSQPTGASATDGMITFVGIQLSNHCGETPKEVRMPNGNSIKVGSRIPWWCALGMGRRSFVAGDLNFQMNVGGQYVQYTPAVDCPIEIHSVNSNFFTTAGESLNPDDQHIKITEDGKRGLWTPDALSPITGVMGDMAQVYPALPFNKPYLLEPLHKLKVSIQNTNASTAVNDAFVTILGVKLCEI